MINTSDLWTILCLIVLITLSIYVIVDRICKCKEKTAELKAYKDAYTAAINASGGADNGKAK